LEIIDADFLCRMHVPSGFREQRRDMATRTVRFAIKDNLAAHGRAFIKAPRWWLGRRDGELIKMERRKFGGY
jgi:hypothetical protein